MIRRFSILLLISILSACGSKNTKPQPNPNTAKWNTAKWNEAKWE